LDILQSLHNFLHPPLIRMGHWLNATVKNLQKSRSVKASDNCKSAGTTAGEMQKLKNETAQLLADQKKIQAAQQSDSVKKTGELLAEASMDTVSEEKLPDVLLDVPSLKIDEIKLNVDNLDARVALRAELADLVKIDIGVQVGIAKVDLDIKGVDAQAVLKVRLKQIYSILARALDTIDKNPGLLENLLKAPQKVTGNAGNEMSKSIDKTINTVESDADKAAAAGEQSLRPLDQEGAGEVKAQGGQISEALREVSKNVDRSIEPRKKILEEERRRMNRIDKL
jgi:hypothetical protein